MRVLFCTNAFSTVSNGPAKFAAILASTKHLSGNREIRILTEDSIESQGNVYQVKLKYPAFFQPFSQFIRMYQYHRVAMQIRKNYPFDVLVYNNALVGFLSMLLFRGTTGMINDYTNATWNEDPFGKSGEKNLKRRVFFEVEKWFCRLSRRKIITNSQYLSSVLTATYGVDSSRFSVLHKGIEEKLIAQNRQELLQNKISNSVLFVKTNYLLAGFSDLADALKILDKEIRLTVIGPAESNHNSIREMFHGSKVQLDLRAHQNQDKVFELMKSHRVFCLPSYKEAFGVAILEALSCACRVVASRTGGIPEATGNGPWGFLFSPGNPGELAISLEQALCSSDEVINEPLEQHLLGFAESRLVNRFFEILENDESK
jgi:glycosyltransferase involved in cell wall biosynthesis